MKAKETYIDLKHISFLVSDGFWLEDMFVYMEFSVHGNSVSKICKAFFGGGRFISST